MQEAKTTAFCTEIREGKGKVIAMNDKKKFKLTRKTCSKAISWALSASMLVGSCFTANAAQTDENLGSVSQGDAVWQDDNASVSGGDMLDVSGNNLLSVSGGDLFAARKTGSWQDFTMTQEIANLDFGTEVTKDTIFDPDSELALGFSDVEFNNAAAGWVDGVYYPREASKEGPGASYVENGEGYLAISSKVWKETEESGYGVYTYENTSTFDMVLANADYQIDVTFVNPTDTAYIAYVEAEDITKVGDIKVEPNAKVTKSFTAVLVDGILNLKFPVNSSAVSIDQAAGQNAYISNVTITRLATEQPDGKPTLYLASDSTVQTYEKGEYPKTGWGQTLAEFFGDTVTEEKADNCTYGQSRRYVTENVVVENRAIGGRSSKSFVEEGKLDDLLEDVKAGDYLFIQWGHNDATAVRPNRYVSPENFAQWLMYYVDGARQRGAVPVLVTPVARYSQTDGIFNISFGAYRDVMFKLAQEQGIAIVDLGKASTDLCTQFGAEGAKSFFMKLAAGEYENYPGGSNDDTHLQYYGAYKFAQCVAKGILDSENADLKALAGSVKMHIPDKAPDKVSSVKKASAGSSSISLAWEEDENAELYYIYRRELVTREAADSIIMTEEDRYSATPLNKYTDSNCEEGKSYAYAIAAFNEKGVGEMSDVIVVATKEAGIRIDFNYGNSPTMEGWTPVNEKTMYGEQENAQSYGWITSPGGGRDRNQGSEMERDFVLGEGEFAYDMPNGDYEVTIYSGDITGSSQKTNFAGEGLSIGTASSSKGVGSVTGTVRVEDGQMNIVITKGNGYGYTNGMTVTELLLAPSGVYAQEIIVGDTNATFQIFFTEVEGAVSYNVYLKNSTDDAFKVGKNITTEDLHSSADVAARTISGDTGEVYECYVTALMEDGSESAASEKINVKLVEEGPKAPAPQNLRCISPSKDSTVLQKEITMGWDAVDGAIKYVIYRNDKVEGDKAYDPEAFVKVGESKTTEFTDTRDVTTNIPYSYKVAAFTKTGIGELSEVCVSNVSGTLVPGGREKYTDRAVVAINLAGDDGGMQVTATDKDGNELTKGVYLSWRSFEADMNDANELNTTFTVKKNGSVIAQDVKVTNLVDEGGTASDTYTVEGSNDGTLGIHSVATKVWNNKYLELNLYAPEDETMPDASVCNYHANDMSVGDLNGDGDLELIVKWYPSNAKDNSGGGYTGKTFLDGYDVDFATGAVKLLWRIDLGVNIRSGAHYTQFQVWDYDGDTKAEIVMKTADGTTTYKSADGTLSGLQETGYVGACNTDALPVETTGAEHDYRNGSGYILEGPEYLTAFNGEDGTILSTADYLPARGNVSAWGDGYGNRVDRFLSATAYLDGETPFAVFARGYYSRTCLTAYYMKDTNNDGIGDKLDVYWEFDSDEAGTQYEAQGNHGIGVNDVDNDGKDEIIYGALVIDHNGTVKYSTGLGHGDAMHISDWVSWNDGLEIMSVHEHGDATYHVEVHDAETGKVLMGYNTGKDTGRGVAADIDPTAEGAEWWSIASPTYEGNDEPSWDSTNGEVYSSWSTLDNLMKLSNVTPASNASIFWDGDLLSEVQDHKFNEKGGYVPIAMAIYKWNYEEEKQEELLYSEEVWSNNGTKGNTGLTADILGDWREEIIVRSSTDKNKVRIYSTTIRTDYVVPCLLENLAYREAVAWQNVGYNQPANTSYLLSEGLVTAQLSEGKVTGDSAEVLFTPANDSNLYGHDITAYEIYRAEGDGAYTKIDTVKTEDLQQGGGNTGDGGTEEQPTEKINYMFDFGGRDGKNGVVGPCMDGFTEINSDTPAYEDSDKGYGLTKESLAGVTFRYYNGGTQTFDPVYDESYAPLFDDCAMGWNSDVEFKVNVPNGKYEVTVFHANNAGTVKNYVYVEDYSKNVARFANKNTANVVALTGENAVEVTDGTLDIKVTLTEGFAGSTILSGLIIKSVEEDKPAEKPEQPEGKDVYSYTDTTVKSNTQYSYKIAAVVDGKTSHMSRPVDIKTAIQIAEVLPIELPDLVEGTPIPEGQTVADLLPKTVKVKDENGQEQDAEVTWDVTDVDINKAGDYTVKASVKGYDKTIDVALKVVSNEVKGVRNPDDITIIAGTKAPLPETVTVEYTNTTTEEKKVTWDTSSLKEDVIGDYTLEGTVEGIDRKATVVVHVKDNYVVSVDKVYAEIELNADAAAAMPKKVMAQFADGTRSEVEVTWNLEGVDTSKPGTAEVTGTAQDFDGDVIAEVSVVYPLTARFDFGIDSKRAAEGWTTVTVNKKGGKETAEQLGIAYTPEKGYGFENADAVIEGRTEIFTQEGALPENVYTDFVLPSGQTFLLDVENGTYEVEMIAACGLKGNSGSYAEIEGVTFDVGHRGPSYASGKQNVEVKDGQLTVKFSDKLSRTGALVVRAVSVETEKPEEVNKEALKTAIDQAKGIDLSKYTEESAAALKAALEAAESAFANDKATQEEVNAAAEALNKAIEELKPADPQEPETPEEEAREELKETVEESYGIDLASYTEESVAAFMAARNAAEAVLADENATKEEIDAAIDALNQAIAALTPDQGGDDGNGGSGDQGGNGGNGGSGDQGGDGSNGGSGDQGGDGGNGGSGDQSGNNGSGQSEGSESQTDTDHNGAKSPKTYDNSPEEQKTEQSEAQAAAAVVTGTQNPNAMLAVVMAVVAVLAVTAGILVYRKSKKEEEE